MRLASLISGGKDSLYAAWLAKQQGHTIDFLLGMLPATKESYMFHGHNLHVLETIAELTGITLITETTAGVKEEELADLGRLLSRVTGKIDGVTTGAVASNYQKKRIDNLCAELGLQSIAPFWGKDPEQVLRAMLRDGFKIMIVAVAAPPLDAAWLGRIIDEQCVDELVMLNKTHGIHILGEGGEMDTVVLSCPLYRGKRVVVDEAEKHWDDKTRSGSLVITKTHTT